MPGPRPVAVPVHTWMVAYDVADEKRRRRVAAVLKGYGERVQWSVFECRLSNSERNTLRGRISKAIDSMADSVRWYPVCKICHGRVVQQGKPLLPDDGDDDDGYYVV